MPNKLVGVALALDAAACPWALARFRSQLPGAGLQQFLVEGVLNLDFSINARIVRGRSGVGAVVGFSGGDGIGIS